MEAQLKKMGYVVINHYEPKDNMIAIQTSEKIQIPFYNLIAHLAANYSYSVVKIQIRLETFTITIGKMGQIPKQFQIYYSNFQGKHTYKYDDINTEIEEKTIVEDLIVNNIITKFFEKKLL